MGALGGHDYQAKMVDDVVAGVANGPNPAYDKFAAAEAVLEEAGLRFETQELHRLIGRLAEGIEERRKREAADREAEARADLDAECALVVEEIGALGHDLRACAWWGHNDGIKLSSGAGDSLNIARDSLWWRLYLAAARELRRLRTELAAKPRAEKPMICIGRETLRHLGKGAYVPLDKAVLCPGVDFPRALHQDVDALAELILDVIRSHALSTFGGSVDPRAYAPATCARRIAEALCW